MTCFLIWLFVAGVALAFFYGAGKLSSNEQRSPLRRITDLYHPGDK